MGRFIHSETGVVVSVADDKDERFAAPLWAAHDGQDFSGGTTETGDDGQNDEVPAGSVAELTEWVGEDAGRAARALEAEQSKGEKARSSLVAHLTKLLDAEQSDDE